MTTDVPEAFEHTNGGTLRFCDIASVEVDSADQKRERVVMRDGETFHAYGLSFWYEKWKQRHAL